ncbi:MAG TPA: 4Fe-4S binding protein [Firmicutes bacterium]|nr:4Fe-4S binding protein [Candidatus Fermentithermobacillaceae bacterium]
MRYNSFGATGLRVSDLCFGSLPFSRAHYNVSPDDSAYVIDFAWDMGVNFFDTADFYDTYAHLKKVAKREGSVIASRSFAFDREGMRRSLDRARRELGRDTLDIFGLHEQESALTLKGHREALEYLVREKERGTVRAIAVSTHTVDCVRAAATMSEVDIIFAILNVEGLGIRGGCRADMEKALELAWNCGKGIYLMKALGGGHLYSQARRALEYVRDFPHKHSVAVGMHTPYEVQFAARVFAREEPPAEEISGGPHPRRLVIEDWCEGCGQCVEACDFGALSMGEGRPRVAPAKCVLCGYCAKVCPHFCLKVM